MESNGEEADSLSTDSLAPLHDDDDDEGNFFISEDEQVLFFSGVCSGAGTSPDYWTTWYFNGENGESCEHRIEKGPYYSNIHVIHKADGTDYYIVKCFAKSCSTEGHEWLEAYKIVGDSLMEVSVIDGKGKASHVDFSVSYNIPEWSGTVDEEGNSWFLNFDAETQNLLVPLFESGKLLYDRCNVWHFDGEKFVVMGVAAIKKEQGRVTLTIK